MHLLGEKNYGSGILEVCTEQISDQKKIAFLGFTCPLLKGILKKMLLHLFKTLLLCNGEKKRRVFKNLLRTFSLPFYQTTRFTLPR